MRSDHDALLRAVIESPDDDAPRLIYADWCDENGDPERAEFIRVQIALEREPRGRKRRELQARADQLSVFEDRWTTEFDEVVPPEAARPWVFRRGFVEELELTASSFVGNAGWLFDRTPLSGVRLPHQPDVRLLTDRPLSARLHSLEFDFNPPCEPDGLLSLLSSPGLAGIRQLAFVDDPDRPYDGFPPRYPSQACDRLASNLALKDLRSLKFHGIRHLDWDGLRAARWLPQLAHWEMSACGLNCYDVYRLLETPTLTGLKVLNLAENLIGDSGLGVLLDEAKWLESLELLDVTSDHHKSGWWGTEFDGDDDPPSPETIRRLKERFGPRLRI